MNLHASSDETFAHWLHLLALESSDSALAKGYARRDARLRKSAGLPPRVSDGIELPYKNVRELLADEPTEPPDHDRQWFQTRWALGEKEAMEEHGQKMVNAIGELPQSRLLSASPMRLVCTPPLAQSALAHPAGHTVVCGPDADPLWVVLQAFVAMLTPALPLEPLPQSDHVWVAAHVAIGVWHHALGPADDLPLWAESLAAHFLPPLEKGEETAERVHRIAEHVLDQPPGETLRIAGGLAARMPSRLIRAWRRGYFVPPAFDLKGWVRAQGLEPSDTQAET